MIQRISLLWLIATLTWRMTGVFAEIGSGENLYDYQTGDLLGFPYCRCERGQSAYSLAPTVVSKGGGQYCFKVIVKNCSANCCKVDLKKIEFNVNAACLVKSAIVRATVNGNLTAVGPNFYKPLDSPPGSAILRLTSLGLGLGSNGTEICLTLKAGVNSTGCDTLEELCIPPPGANPGVCQVAMFNNNNSTGACCPQSTPGLPKPQPPSPPQLSPKPSSPPPPASTTPPDHKTPPNAVPPQPLPGSLVPMAAPKPLSSNIPPSPSQQHTPTPEPHQKPPRMSPSPSPKPPATQPPPAFPLSPPPLSPSPSSPESPLAPSPSAPLLPSAFQQVQPPSSSLPFTPPPSSASPIYPPSSTTLPPSQLPVSHSPPPSQPLPPPPNTPLSPPSTPSTPPPLQSPSPSLPSSQPSPIPSPVYPPPPSSPPPSHPLLPSASSTQPPPSSPSPLLPSTPPPLQPASPSSRFPLSSSSPPPSHPLSPPPLSPLSPSTPPPSQPLSPSPSPINPPPSTSSGLPPPLPTPPPSPRPPSPTPPSPQPPSRPPPSPQPPPSSVAPSIVRPSPWSPSPNPPSPKPSLPLSSPNPPSPPPPSPPPPIPLRNPPPPPARPSPPQPPPPCSLCIHIRLVSPIIDFPTFRFNNATCQQLQKTVAGPMNTQFTALNVTVLKPFAADPQLCSSVETQICTSVVCPPDDVQQRLQSVLQNELDLGVGLLSGSVCPASSGYTIRALSGTQDFLNLRTISNCKPGPDPFPGCRCDKRQGIIPLYVMPTVESLPGRTSATILHCFRLGMVPPLFRTPSSCGGNTLNKAEFWADESNRRMITGFRLTPRGGSPRFISVSWAAPDDNTVKATMINWNYVQQADGGEICMELRKEMPLSDFCLGGGSGCSVALFNEQRDCCPTFGAAPFLTNP